MRRTNRGGGGEGKDLVIRYHQSGAQELDGRPPLSSSKTFNLTIEKTTEDFTWKRLRFSDFHFLRECGRLSVYRTRERRNEKQEQRQLPTGCSTNTNSKNRYPIEERNRKKGRKK